MSGEHPDDKPHDPSQKRLDEARKRGEIPRSADLTVAAVYGGLLLASGLAGAAVLRRLGTASTVLLDQADRLAPMFFDQAAAPVGGLLAVLGLALLPLFAMPGLAAVLALIGQRALHVAPEKLHWKLSRLSPLANARQKFGRDGLMEFAKALLRLVAVAVCLATFLSGQITPIISSASLSPGQAMALMLRLVLQFLGLVSAITLAFGVLDYLWQRHRHLLRNRMSRKEMLDETRESEGDPHVKMQRRQRGQEIATNRMLQDVARADVVVVNPTHFAVALKWRRGDRGAPVCLAKGVDEIATRIRERAALAGVPLHSDPPTARALFASVEVGQPVRPEHYKAVAAAIRFAENMRKRKGKAR